MPIPGANSPRRHNDHDGRRGGAGVDLVYRFRGCRALLQFDLIQLLLNAPELDIELVESLSSPLLSTMTIDVGLCVPIELPLPVDEV